jgi:hypothetical protein
MEVEVRKRNESQGTGDKRSYCRPKILWKEIISPEALKVDQKLFVGGRVESGSAGIAETCMKYFKDKFVGSRSF